MVAARGHGAARRSRPASASRCCTSAGRPRSRRRRCPRATASGPSPAQQAGGERRRERVAGADPAQDLDVDAGHGVAPASVVTSETPPEPCLSTIERGAGIRRDRRAQAGRGELRVAADEDVGQPGRPRDQRRRLGRVGPQRRPPVEVEDRRRRRAPAAGRESLARGAGASSSGPARSARSVAGHDDERRLGEHRRRACRPRSGGSRARAPGGRTSPGSARAARPRRTRPASASRAW